MRVWGVPRYFREKRKERRMIRVARFRLRSKMRERKILRGDMYKGRGRGKGKGY